MTALGLMVVRGAPEAGLVVPAPPGRRLRLGRHGPEHGIDLRVTDFTVNRHHAEVWWEDGGLWVGDLNSRNGTFVNGARIHGPTRLRPCDGLWLARVRLLLTWLGPVDPAWLAWGGGAVPRIARELREAAEGAGRGFAVLHDALLDAGCEDEAVLGHCRAGCVHGASCTLLPLLAGGGGRA